MQPTRPSANEVAARGWKIYELRLRDLLEPDNNGKFLVIDIETGEYEIDEDDYTASMRAYNKRPDGIHYGMRVGYATSGTL